MATDHMEEITTGAKGGNQKPHFSRIQVMEATAAALLAASIIGTAGGVGWLAVALPNQLRQMQDQIKEIIGNQNSFRENFTELQKQVNEHDRRLIRLELQ